MSMEFYAFVFIILTVMNIAILYRSNKEADRIDSLIKNFRFPKEKEALIIHGVSNVLKSLSIEADLSEPVQVAHFRIFFDSKEMIEMVQSEIETHD
jgi:hypothetical protein